MSADNAPNNVKVLGPRTPGIEEVLTPEALEFVADLHRTFEPTRRELLSRRRGVAQEIHAGGKPGFAAETLHVRESEWTVAEAPDDLNDRRTEITGPVEKRMMINALNSGARVFMADLEDSLSPTWENVVAGQKNLADAVRRRLELTTPEGKEYRLKDEIATLVVRPRGWHLDEIHLTVDGEPVSASLFDAGLYLFHNAAETLARGTGPYFYLPKMEHYLEARLWNDVFNHAQDRLNVPRGSVRATVLIETILAAFCMDEILFELRQHAAGLNAGRWDYIFSMIKRFRSHEGYVMPDRAQVTMTVPFMRAYTELLVRTCHRRGAHAIGGMAAFIPSRRDESVNKVAIPKVREDKERESGDGFDGTWVAHPDLVPVAMEVFDGVLGSRPNQKDRMREDVSVEASQLLDPRIPGSAITEDGVRNDISVALQYIDNWLRGTGAVAIFNLMEDAATAEIARSQLWQWLHAGSTLDDGTRMTRELYERLRDEELGKLERGEGSRLDDAVGLLDRLVLEEEFIEFLTLPAYPMLDRE